VRPVESANPRIAGILDVSAHVLRTSPDDARDALHDLAHRTLENVAPEPGDPDVPACHAVGYALQVGLLVGYHLAAADALAADVVDLPPKP
jgi:hypothetical protein